MRKYLIIAAGVLVLAAAPGVSPAWAGWGCGAIAPDGSMGRTWAAPTEEAARKNALHFCHEEGHHSHCRVISCSVNIDTQNQAHVLWPSKSPVDTCHGSGPCQLGH